MSCETCGTSIDFCDSCSTCHICLEEDRQRLTAELAKKSDLYAGVKTLCEQQIEQNQQLRDVLEKLARLGNEPHYGNSEGNRIAQKALEGEDNG